MPDNISIPDIIISAETLDKIAGMMVLIQRTNVSELLRLGNLVEAVKSQLQNIPDVITSHVNLINQSHAALAEIAKIRGPWVVCHLCNPPVRMEISKAYEHDTTLHGAYKSR